MIGLGVLWYDDGRRYLASGIKKCQVQKTIGGAVVLLTVTSLIWMPIMKPYIDFLLSSKDRRCLSLLSCRRSDIKYKTGVENSASYWHSRVCDIEVNDIAG